MHVREISEEEVYSVCTREESHFFDRKACGIRGAKVQKISVAFANADGGEFAIGVADDKDESDPAKRWNGFGAIEDINGTLQALFEPVES